MPMMIVNDDEFENELIKKNSIPDNVIQRPFHGRSPSDTNVPPVIREIIADDSEKGGRDLAKTFGVSESSVSAYRHGATSTATYDKQSHLSPVIDRKRERISKKSTRALLRTLNQLDTDDFEAKLAACKPVEMSTVAANLSRVVEKVSIQQQEIKQQNIVFYTPSPLKSDSFEIIDLGRKVIENH